MKKFIYFYDAFCPWCYAFAPVLQSMFTDFGKTHEFEVLSGGMLIGDNVKMIGGLEASEQLRNSYKKIEQRTGIPFGESFFKAVSENKMLMNSEVAATALAVFRQTDTSNSAIDFIHQLQYSIFFKGRDPNQEGFYEKLATHFHLEPGLFIQQMKEETFQQQARYDFALAKQLHAETFPRLYLQTSETYFHLISKGYSDYDDIVKILDKIFN